MKGLTMSPSQSEQTLSEVIAKYITISVHNQFETRIFRGYDDVIKTLMNSTRRVFPSIEETGYYTDMKFLDDGKRIANGYIMFRIKDEKPQYVIFEFI